MSGIALWYDRIGDLRERRGVIENMSCTMCIKGSDQKSDYTDKQISLIHAGPCKNNAEGKSPPVSHKCSTGTLFIVYAGELYNALDIRRDLLKDGVEIQCTDDAEIVLNAYAHWGPEALSRFNGMFAFAVWNKTDGSIFLARDRLGLKPLYYSRYSGGFTAASKIRTILETKAVKPIIDETSLNEIFMLGPARTPGSAIYRDIRELPPAHYLIFKNEKITIYPYWKLEAKEHGETLGETIDHTLFLIKDAVSGQLASEAAPAVFLSGGLDSSLLAKIAADDYKKNGKGALSTYSWEYTDNDPLFGNLISGLSADHLFTDMMRTYIQSDHHCAQISSMELADALVDSTYARGTPGMGDIDASLYLLCREAGKTVSSALSGDGADEIFGGYFWYHNRDILFDNTFPWSRSTVLRHAILRDSLLKDGDDYVENAYRQTIRTADMLTDELPLEKRMREMFLLNINWFLQTALIRADTMGTHSGIEIRMPFCDHRIVEYAYNIPWKFKALDGLEKGLVRKAAEPLLPDEIVWRKKMMRSGSKNPAYFEIVCAHVRELLSERNNPLCSMLNKDKIAWIMEHPHSIALPWYSPLMQAPQIMAYLIQIDTFFKDNNVIVDF